MQDILHPSGELDVLPYYSKVADKLRNFLDKKEIATKVWLPNPKFPFFLKRGSKEEPLYVNELADNVTEKMLSLRKENLESVKSKLTLAEQKIWIYFVPRKLCDFFYATNCEGAGKPIDDIFFDLDRGAGITAQQAQFSAQFLLELIEKENFGKTVVAWTGKSFHIHIILDKKQPLQFYEDKFAYSKNSPLKSLTGKWAAEIQKQTDFKVSGGHEKLEKTLSIDPSQTPSGKLCRIPLGGLHMKDAKTVDGVSVPIKPKDLGKKTLINELESYTPEKVLKELNSLAKIIDSVIK